MTSRLPPARATTRSSWMLENGPLVPRAMTTVSPSRPEYARACMAWMPTATWRPATASTVRPGKRARRLGVASTMMESPMAVRPRYTWGSALAVSVGLGLPEGSGSGAAVPEAPLKVPAGGGTTTIEPCARVWRTEASGAACDPAMQEATARHSTTKTTGGNRVAVWRPRGIGAVLPGRGSTSAPPRSGHDTR